MRLLVTGAGGYLGGRLVRHLVERADCEVVAGTRRHHPWLEPAEQLRVAPEAAVEELVPTMSRAEAVVHLAAPSAEAMRAEPDASFGLAVAGARHLALACRAAGVGRLVYVSTAHVYGTAMLPGATLTESVAPEPRDHYALARLASEHAAAAATGGEVELVVLRLANCVGAPLDPSISQWTLVANDLCRQAATTGCLRLLTHGLQWRDFLAIDDACRAIEAAAGLCGEGAAALPPGLYNCGSGVPRTVRGLAGLVQDAWERATGERPPLEAPERPAAPPLPWRLSTERLGARGFTPSTTLEEALDETVAACLDAWGDAPAAPPARRAGHPSGKT